MIDPGDESPFPVEVTATGEMTSWEDFTEAAGNYGVPDASLWACLIHDVTTAESAAEGLSRHTSLPRWLCRLAGVPPELAH